MNKSIQIKQSLHVPADATKKDLQMLAESMVNNLDQDPLQAAVRLKRIADFAGMLLDQLKPIVLSEMTDDFVITDGAQISVIYGRKTMDYSHYQAWVDADTERKRIEGLMKAAANQIGTFQMIDEETGEMIPAAKIEKIGSQSIKFKY